MWMSVWSVLCVLACFFSAEVRAEGFLPAEQAFAVSMNPVSGPECRKDCVWQVSIQVADGYYLYRERFRAEAGVGVQALTLEAVPTGIRKHDPFLNQEVETLRGLVQFQLLMSWPTDAAVLPSDAGHLVLQGCADAGLCYPPMKVPVRGALSNQTPQVLGLLGQHASSFGTLQQQPEEPVVVSTPTLPIGLDDEASTLAARLAGQSGWVILPIFFGLGLLLAFTPCMLPMLPIVSGLVLGKQSNGASRARPLGLAAMYVLGMALMYAGLGVLAGLSGEGLAAALQTRWVLWSLGGLMAVLGAGVVLGREFQLPAQVQSWVSAQANRAGGGRWAGVFVMGVLSGLLLGPCVAPPLAGALLYIGQTGNAGLGGLALFVMALGMGFPLLVFVGGAGALLPKRGSWMQAVTLGLGLMLLATAVWVVTPVTPVSVVMALWCVWSLLGAVLVLRRYAGWVAKGLACVFLFLTGLQGLGVVTGANSVLRPWERVFGGIGEQEAKVTFQRVSSAQVLNLLRTSTSPVMLDFYADWCVSCKEFEHFTLPKTQVRERLEGIQLLQVDVTANTSDDQTLLKQFGLFGPPAILFFPAGQQTDVFRVIGFENEERFSASLDTARSRY